MKPFEDHRRLHWGDIDDGGTNHMLAPSSETVVKTENLRARTPVKTGSYYKISSGDEAYNYFKGNNDPVKSLNRQNMG